MFQLFATLPDCFFWSILSQRYQVLFPNNVIRSFGLDLILVVNTSFDLSKISINLPFHSSQQNYTQHSCFRLYLSSTVGTKTEPTFLPTTSVRVFSWCLSVSFVQSPTLSQNRDPDDSTVTDPLVGSLKWLKDGNGNLQNCDLHHSYFHSLDTPKHQTVPWKLNVYSFPEISPPHWPNPRVSM